MSPQVISDERESSGEDKGDFWFQLNNLRNQYGDKGYGEASNKFKIHYWETNKIRILLARYYNTGGYPVRWNYHVGYYSGIAQWVPDQWSINGKRTRELWENSPNARWVFVVMYKVDIYDTLEDEIDAGQIKGLLGSIPLVGGIASNIYGMSELGTVLSTQKIVPIYPNLLFYNTTNDKILFANWDLVLIDLNKIEELKYLSPEGEITEPLYTVS